MVFRGLRCNVVIRKRSDKEISGEEAVDWVTEGLWLKDVFDCLNDTVLLFLSDVVEEGKCDGSFASSFRDG